MQHSWKRTCPSTWNNPAFCWIWISTDNEFFNHFTDTVHVICVFRWAHVTCESVSKSVQSPYRPDKSLNTSLGDGFSFRNYAARVRDICGNYFKKWRNEYNLLRLIHFVVKKCLKTKVVRLPWLIQYFLMRLKAFDRLKCYRKIPYTHTHQCNCCGNRTKYFHTSTARKHGKLFAS